MIDMRAIAAVSAVTIVALSTSACERRPDVPPAQPMEGAPEQAPLPPEQGVAPGAPAGGVTVELQGRDGQSVGGARLEPESDGVRVSIRVSGLTPDQQHGLHFHAAGRCEGPAFESAGPHFAPHARQHGFENPQGPHAGDLPNVRANADGVADTTFVVNTVRLASGVEQGLFTQEGTALVVHARQDDYRTDPSGNSGDRIACGIIRGG